jgi:hypothetical protein
MNASIQTNVRNITSKAVIRSIMDRRAFATTISLSLVLISGVLLSLPTVGAVITVMVPVPQALGCRAAL